MLSTEVQKKYDDLKTYIEKLGSLAVAYSGGVDSTTLLTVADEVLAERAIGIIAKTTGLPAEDFSSARRYCSDNGIRIKVFGADLLHVEGMAENPENRCYLCKNAVFKQIIEHAGIRGAEHVADGTNADDLKENRPGYKALQELGVLSPLAECGFTKKDVRELAKELEIPVWNKHSNTCLLTRFPYGTKLDREAILTVDKAEAWLRGQGFENVRVRVHGSIARIEVSQDKIEEAAKEPVRTSIVEAMRGFGYTYVTLDLDGYRSGSMDE